MLQADVVFLLSKLRPSAAASSTMSLGQALNMMISQHIHAKS